MTDETKTCQVKMANLQPCGRDLDDGEKCICHSENPEKNVAQFWQHIRKELRPGGKEIHDFTRFVFPESPREIRQGIELTVFFTNAKFLGTFSFEGSIFKGSARFDNAVFEKRVFFHETTFQGEAFFAHVDFKNGACFTQASFANAVIFDKASFGGVAEFYECRFHEDATFDEVEFKNVANFENSCFESGAKFGKARFSKDANFDNVVFHQEALFRYSHFDKCAVFSRATFEGRADFCHRRFGGKAWFNDVTFKSNVEFTSTAFKDSAYFVTSRFFGTAVFFEAKFFSEVADFSWARFGGLTNFDSTKFGAEALYVDATFSDDATFMHCTFDNLASFLRVRLTEQAHLIFDTQDSHGDRSAMFVGQADFRSIRMDKGAELHFRCLSLDQCRFLGSKTESMEFTDVAWPSRRKHLGRDWFYRKAVYDELNPQGGQSWEQVADIYRGLQEYYHQRNRYQEAGSFYIAEQDINNKVKRKLPYRVSTRLYRIVSVYGESFLRPLIWLGLFLVMFPSIFLWGGIDLSPHIDPSTGPVDIVSYEFSFWPQDCFLLTDDFKEAFNANLSFITLNRVELTGRLPYSGQRALAGLEMVLVVILVSFVVLALRRQYKRKSF